MFHEAHPVSADVSYDGNVNELVCLDMDNGPSLVDRIRRAWDNGDAIFPLDQRLPDTAKRTLITHVRPTIIATESDDTRVAGTPVDSGDAVVVATSGSTGVPKAAVLTHDAVAASARAVHQRLGVTEDDSWYACLPVAHVGGLSVVMRSLILGTRLVADPRFSVEGYREAARNGCTLVSLVSTAMQRVDTSAFRWIVLGGAKPPQDRPSNSVATYGLTETGSGVVYNGQPLQGVEIKITDGVIQVRCPMLLRSYRDGTIPLDAEGWFRTGDLGHWADDGCLVVDGREGDLIITGGENVWPDAVEATLLKLATVTDVCVAGLPDGEWGQKVTAWVVSDHDISLDIVRSHVKEELPPFCAPRRVIRVDEIPRTALGKPRRAELVAAAMLLDD